MLTSDQVKIDNKSYNYKYIYMYSQDLQLHKLVKKKYLLLIILNPFNKSLSKSFNLISCNLKLETDVKQCHQLYKMMVIFPMTESATEENRAYKQCPE
jgi:hypothetical protein